MVAKADKKSLVLCLTLVIAPSLDVKAAGETAVRSPKEPPTTYLCQHPTPTTPMPGFCF